MGTNEQILATQAKQAAILQMISDFKIMMASSAGGSILSTFECEITRTNVTTAYVAGKVVGDVGGAYKLFSNVAISNNTGVRITRVRIQSNDTNLSGKSFNVHIYNDIPDTYLADYSDFVINYTNSSKRIGSFPIVMGTGNKATVGHNDYNQMILKPAGKDIYFILESVDGFTPSAASTKFKIIIECELSNK